MERTQGTVQSPSKYRETEGITVYRKSVLEPRQNSGNQGTCDALIKRKCFAKLQFIR